MHKHKWKVIGNYSGGSDGAVCEKGCNARLGHEEVDSILAVSESLRAVARAADRLLKEHPTWLTQEETYEALDALPAWVLEEEE